MDGRKAHDIRATPGANPDPQDMTGSFRESSDSESTKKTEMSTIRILIIWVSMSFGVACTFLDEGIIATAIPKITDEFHSLGDVGVSQTLNDQSHLPSL